MSMKPEAMLKKQTIDGRLVSSYIFSGSDLQLSHQAARGFAADLEISQFDIVEIMPEIKEKNPKGEIRIAQIRELVRKINLTPGKGKRKLAIIKDADKLSTDAANTLLKTLEEPPKSSLIILLSRDLKLLPTIISRCQIIRFLDREEQEDENIVNELLGTKNRNLKQAFAAAEKISADDDLENYLEKVLGNLKSKLADSPEPELLSKIKAIFAAKKNLKITTNKKLVLENLILDFQNE